jgi:hypothetical protein
LKIVVSEEARPFNRTIPFLVLSNKLLRNPPPLRRQLLPSIIQFTQPMCHWIANERHRRPCSIDTARGRSCAAPVTAANSATVSRAASHRHGNIVTPVTAANAASFSHTASHRHSNIVAPVTAANSASVSRAVRHRHGNIVSPVTAANTASVSLAASHRHGNIVAPVTAANVSLTANHRHWKLLIGSVCHQAHQ